MLELRSEKVIDYAYRYFLDNDINKPLGKFNMYMRKKFGFNPTNLESSDTYRVIHCFDKAIVLYDDNPKAVKYYKLDWTIIFDGDMSLPRIDTVLEDDCISTEVAVVETKLEALKYKLDKFKDKLHNLNTDDKEKFICTYEKTSFIVDNMVKLL